jgi:RNA polymerase sigma-70 factor (ECF subfamily)
VQECLARLFAQSRNGRLRDDTRAVRSLAFTVLHNLAVDWRRTAKTTTQVVESIPARGQHGPERALLRVQLERAMAELPDNQRAALALREFGELSYAEIAATLDASIGEVKIWIHRARKRLARLLDRDGQYIGSGRP